MANRDIQALLTRLSRLNRTGVFFATLVIVLAAFIAPGWYGVALLILLAAAMIAMVALTWRIHAPTDRRQRLVMVAILLAVMVLAAIRKVG